MTGSPRGISIVLVTAVTLLASSASCLAFKVLPASLHIEQSPGQQQTYEILLLNDTDQPETLDIRRGEWLRNDDGSYDWGIPIHGARWVYSDPISAGTTLEIRYRVTAAELAELFVVDYFEGASWQGALTSDHSQSVTTPDTRQLVGSSDPANPFPITATRTVMSGIDEHNAQVAFVVLEVTCHEDCPSLTVYEVFSESVSVSTATGTDSGWAFATVNRSNIDWIEVAETSLTLDPNEERSLELIISTPESADGTSWSAVFIIAEPSISTVDGAQLVSIYRTAIKVFVTVPGTELPSGEVTSVTVNAVTGDESTVSFVFANTGNTLLTATGNVSIVDVTGAVVREAMSEDLQVLPESARSSTIESFGSEPLPPGVYQAIVSVDYGGDELAGGVRTFRIR
ncbi:hypothetical protein JW848_00715 [Candidatus Bipolaricaulota bacterium]|nr:hypothetical protein [Candidatus Bipolaricaulota bacterium]